MLSTKIVLNVRNNFCTQHVLPRFVLGIFMYWTCNSMNNLLPYCGLVDAKIRASDKDLPVSMYVPDHDSNADADRLKLRRISSQKFVWPRKLVEWRQYACTPPAATGAGGALKRWRRQRWRHAAGVGYMGRPPAGRSRRRRRARLSRNRMSAPQDCPIRTILLMTTFQGHVALHRRNVNKRRSSAVTLRITFRLNFHYIL